MIQRGMEDWMLWSNQKILRSRAWFVGSRRVLQVKETALEKDFQMQISLYSKTAKFLIISFDFFHNFLNLFAFLNFGFKSISWAIYTLRYVHQLTQVILWESQWNKWSLMKKQECVFEKLCIIKYLPSDIYTNHCIFI